MTTTNAPQGELVLRTLAMPADTNANGDIFGGWLMSQMDMGGAILAKEIAHGRVVTVRVDGMTFLRPVAVGDVVCCYARCVKRGNTSISINIEQSAARLAWLIAPSAHGRFHFALKHIRRLRRQDFHIIHAAIRSNVKFHPYAAFNTQGLSSRRILRLIAAYGARARWRGYGWL